MRTIATHCILPAPLAAAWSLLTDFHNYPAWNPFIRHIEGEQRTGARLYVELHPPGQRTMVFHPRLQRYEPQRALVWRGSLGLPGLFDGEHHFMLTPQADGNTRLDHFEHFRGLLTGLILSGAAEPTRQGFEAMNQAMAAQLKSATAAV